MMKDLILIGMGATTIVTLVLVLITFARTRDPKVLRKFVTSKTDDVELTTVLEQRFARLSPTAQETILRLIRVADPFTDYFADDLPKHTVDWLKEITDKVPVKDKPPVLPLDTTALFG